MLTKQRILYFLSIGITIVVIFNLSQSVINSYHGNYRLSQLQAQVELTTQKIKSLRETLEIVQNDKFIEEQARNKLNLIKPGENIVISGKVSGKNNGAILGKEQEKQWQTWEKWRYLFLHF